MFELYENQSHDSENQEQIRTILNLFSVPDKENLVEINGTYMKCFGSYIYENLGGTQ